MHIHTLSYVTEQPTTTTTKNNHYHHHQRYAAQGFLPTTVGRPLCLCLERLAMSMAGGDVCGEGAAAANGPGPVQAPLLTRMARAGEVEEHETNVGLRAQVPPPPGTRPAALREPVPQLGLEHAACPCAPAGFLLSVRRLWQMRWVTRLTPPRFASSLPPL